MFPNQIYDTLRGMTQTCMTRHGMYADGCLRSHGCMDILQYENASQGILRSVTKKISPNCLTKWDMDGIVPWFCQ